MLLIISCKIFEVKFWHLIIVWFHGLIFNILIIYLFWMRHIREQVEIISSLLPLYMSRNPVPGGMVGGKLLSPWPISLAIHFNFLFFIFLSSQNRHISIYEVKLFALSGRPVVGKLPKQWLYCDGFFKYSLHHDGKAFWAK